MKDTGVDHMVEFYREMRAPVSSKDLRLLVAERGLAGNTKRYERQDDEHGVLFDLESSSLLSQLKTPYKFRVADYDPNRTENFQSNGRHVYVIAKEILESDVVVSVPKFKTHQKVGITCGLKGFVGAVAHKDCLAHHRFGPATEGGDEYPIDRLGVLKAVSRFHDQVQKMAPTHLTGNMLRVLDRVTRRTVSHLTPITAGSWFGNDTAWRMALDVYRILKFGKPDGTLASTSQRRHLIFVDGVVGGEGEGPLAPKPVQSGVCIFSDDVPIADWAAALLMGFDPERIPLVREAIKLGLSSSSQNPYEQELIFNTQKVNMGSALLNNNLSFKPPRGWNDHIEIFRE